MILNGQDAAIDKCFRLQLLGVGLHEFLKFLHGPSGLMVIIVDCVNITELLFERRVVFVEFYGLVVVVDDIFGPL